jgi:DNA-binding GntR family transcriptional regulator
MDASAKEHIATQLREHIATGVLPLGASLSDKALAGQLRISRTPVREALLQLRSEGLVVMRPQSGTYVFDPSPHEVEEICQLRSILETGALQVVTKKELPGLVRALEANLGQAAASLKARDYARADELDAGFHETIVGLCGNALLVQTYRRISNKVRALRHRMPRSHQRFARALAHHRQIAKLLDQGQVGRASAELSAHVNNVQRLLGVGPEAGFRGTGA